MTEPPTEPPIERLSIADLRTLFLFEALNDDQLEWLAAQGEVRHYPSDTVVIAEGQPAEHLFILLAGAIELSVRVQDGEVELNRTDHRGVYAGATQAYIRDSDVGVSYLNTLRTVSDSSFFVLAADDFATMVRDWFPMAIHLLEGLFFGLRASDTLVGQRRRLVALGSLAAGLMHELNNPAAAAVRATSALRERVAGMRHKLGALADGRIDPAQLRSLTELQESVIERVAKAPKLSPMQVSDREDELSDWLEEHGIADGWELAPVFVAAGIDVECLTDLVRRVDPGLEEQALRWLRYSLETEMLMTDIEDATARISSLVGAAKQYSQLDRASHQWIDVHDGIDSTLVMLTHKIEPGVRVVKEYDRTLPRIPALAGELNQVWTNLIDNALYAMAGAGTLTIRSFADGTRIVVEVCDTGPGVPAELRQRVFDPFFTTKPVGDGTGLGLDISYRIVVNRHGGDLSLTSVPGDTRFRVRLPMTEVASH